jgi:carboxyl-terminal processing protease
MKFPVKVATRLLAFGGAIALAVIALADPAATRLAAPQATEADITRLTATILARSQFAHHPLDSELAGKFLDGYLDALDGRRSLFLQSDADEFAKYRGTLAQATREGNTTVARVIWSRYLERLRQRTTYLTQALQTSKWEFTGNDSYFFDRENAPRPRDIAAAREDWREQLRAEYLDEKLRDVAADVIVSTLTRRYAQQLKMMEALGSDEVLEVYLNALAHVYDPHSDYLGHEQMESLSIAMKLSLFGIGAALESKDGYCTIAEILPGGPAARGGELQPGDRIIAVAQGGKDPVDIVNMPLSRAVELIRGKKGTGVTLTIIPALADGSGSPKTISLVRDEIQLQDQQAKGKILDLPRSDGPPLRLGVIDLPSFYADTGGQPGAARRSVTADVARLVTKLKAEGIRGLILDLRRNGGGSLDEAISLTGLFITQGPVVQTRGPEGDVDVDADTDASQLYEGPLVVLTSRFSASASEILAGALADYGRAVLVGDSSTFGKGTVQSVLPLARIMDQNGIAYKEDPGALKITIRKFYRPSGASTQMRGVPSDIVLPSGTDFSAVSESAMKNPLPWDTVPPVPYTKEDRVTPYLDSLRQRSSRRVATERDFAYQAEDIARLQKSVATKTVSLNEAERRQELARAKARESERQRERAARQAARPTTYEITLANAGAKGLPAPAAPPTAAPAGAAPPGAAPPGAAPPGAGDAKRAPSGVVAPGPAESGSNGSPTAEDVLLNETVQILADYVGLLPLKSEAPRPATRASVP